MITDELRERVRELRAQGLSWKQVSRAVGRPQRTCQRAFKDPDEPCAQRGCKNIRVLSGIYCTYHGRKKMGNGRAGERQAELTRLLRKHGCLSSEQMRQMTGMSASHLSHELRDLVRRGVAERRVQGMYLYVKKDDVPR